MFTPVKLHQLITRRNGEPYTIKNAICIHEEDDGILFKHTDFRK
jgi:Cu2+-containing amine oxidase